MSAGSASESVTSTRRPLVLADVRRALARIRPNALEIPGFRAAAVLVPLLESGPQDSAEVDRSAGAGRAGTGLQLLLTVRSATLRSHAGQIALPGGRLEPGESFVDAALRETAEEVGIEVDPTDVIGELSDHPSPAGFVARPIVARVSWPQAVTLDPGEVAEVFTVPLDALRAVEPTSRLVEVEQFRRRIYSYEWAGRDIWGFTGNIIRNLFDVIDGRDLEPDGPYRDVNGRLRDPFGA